MNILNMNGWPPSLNELTPMIFDTGLTHLFSEAVISGNRFIINCYYKLNFRIIILYPSLTKVFFLELTKSLYKYKSPLLYNETEEFLRGSYKDQL